MEELLVDFLMNNTDQINRVNILEAVDLLNEFDYDRHELPVTDAIMNQHNEDAGSTIEQVHSLIKNCLLDVLKMHSIFINPDIPMDVLVRFSHFIKMIEDTEEKQRIEDICYTEMDAAEKIAEIAGVITGYNSDEYMLYLEGASTSLVDSIAILVKSDQPDEIENDETELHSKKDRVIRIANQTGVRAVLDLLTRGLSFNMHLRSYIAISDVFTHSYTDEELVAILMSFAAMSVDYSANPLNEINKIIDENFADMTHQAKLRTLVNQLFVDIGKTSVVKIGGVQS